MTYSSPLSEAELSFTSLLAPWAKQLLTLPRSLSQGKPSICPSSAVCVLPGLFSSIKTSDEGLWMDLIILSLYYTAQLMIVYLGCKKCLKAIMTSELKEPLNLLKTGTNLVYLASSNLGDFKECKTTIFSLR